MDFKINGRTKSIFSIREKMLNKNISIDERYDRFAVRIIYKAKPKRKIISMENIFNCNRRISSKSNQVTRLDLNPKSNGYEALHITVVGQVKDGLKYK